MQQNQQYHVQPHGQGGQWGGPFPSLHLWPIQDTFQMKMIHLPPGQRVKVGRQTNNKTVPGERNAYFDSKVLSRTHAEIWEQGGKIYIKDLKSSNGTFINGARLSAEGVESEEFELKSQDMVEFGIDIISEDNRTIIHHKVSAKAYCVFGPEDAAQSAREVTYYQNDARGVRRMTGGSMGTGNAVNALSQMGPPIMSAGGKANGLSFEHVLQKLQSELSKSKETAAELQGLNTAMNEVQDTLGGGLPPGQNGSASQYIPPQFRNPSAEAQAALAGPHGPQAAAFIALQTQMTDTQSSLSTQLDRIRQLEAQLQQQDVMKNEIASIRQQMEDSKHEMEVLLAAGRSLTSNGNGYRSYGNAHDSDDDDARSVVTVTPDDDDHETGPNGSSKDGAKSEGSNDGGDDAASGEEAIANSDLAARIQSLTSEMEDALQLSRALQAQHGEAMAAVKLLTERVGMLETGISDRVTAAVVQAEERWEAWAIKFEERWKKERDGWEAERERLRGVVREWEEQSRRAVEEDEERAMNEHLSDFDDEDDEDDADAADVEDSELLVQSWQNGLGVDAAGDDLPLGDLSPRLKRRRRPSTKATLALRGLRSVAAASGGTATPKGVPDDASTAHPPGALAHPPRSPRVALPHTREAEPNAPHPARDRDHPHPPRGIDPDLPRPLRKDALARVKKMSREKFRTPTNADDKDSSESGRESADTLRGDKDAERKVEVPSRSPKQQQASSAIPIATVIFVAAVAGLLYVRNKE